MPTALLWLRHDLRLHDHAPLIAAQDHAGPDGRLLAVYCLDPRDFRETDWGVPKTGGHRARFLLESLADLRARMRDRGGDLVVRRGRPEAVVPALYRESGATGLFYHDEPMREEVDVEDALLDALPEADAHVYWGHTLVDIDTLPFSIDGLPRVYTPFRKAAERTQPYPDPLPAPTRLGPLSDGIEPGDIPTVA
ncbi:MAG: deoxyribodipyrimidine photo-lyase, partial [Bacteroidota bacterium]